LVTENLIPEKLCILLNHGYPKVTIMECL
jgi:hypothetical protein